MLRPEYPHAAQLAATAWRCLRSCTESRPAALVAITRSVASAPALWQHKSSAPTGSADDTTTGLHCHTAQDLPAGLAPKRPPPAASRGFGVPSTAVPSGIRANRQPASKATVARWRQTAARQSAVSADWRAPRRGRSVARVSAFHYYSADRPPPIHSAPVSGHGSLY